MTERITIHIEGTVEEVANAIEELARRVGSRIEPQEKEMVKIAWTRREVQRLWRSLKPAARQVLKEVASRPEGYLRAELLSKFSLGGRQLAGRMSSVGHTMRRFFRGKARPVELDTKTGFYRMPPEVAKVIGELP